MLLNHKSHCLYLSWIVNRLVSSILGFAGFYPVKLSQRLTEMLTMHDWASSLTHLDLRLVFVHKHLLLLCN